MKKKILIVLLIVVTLVGLTGCNKKEEKGDVKTTTTTTAAANKIVLNDKGFGKTELSFDKNKDYKLKEETNGKYISIDVESEKENFELQLYHFDTNKNSYETGKKNREKSGDYKEYTWGKFKGYSFDGSKFSIKFNIQLTDDKALFGELDSQDKKVDIREVFKSADFQKLLNSISFTENK